MFNLVELKKEEIKKMLKDFKQFRQSDISPGAIAISEIIKDEEEQHILKYCRENNLFSMGKKDCTDIH